MNHEEAIQKDVEMRIRQLKKELERARGAYDILLDRHNKLAIKHSELMAAHNLLLKKVKAWRTTS